MGETSVTWHLPICRECNELAFTPCLTKADYEGWRSRHEAMGHTIDYGPEIGPYRANRSASAHA